LDLSDRIEAMSSAGGVVLISRSFWPDSFRSSDALIVERFGQFVEAAEVDPVGMAGSSSRGISISSSCSALSARAAMRVAC